MSKVKKKELLNAFERLCRRFGVESAGFDPQLITAPIDKEAHDGKTRWAMSHTEGKGWMIVSGWKGSACRFTRFNGYIKGRWNFLMFLEGLEQVTHMGPLKEIPQEDKPSRENETLPQSGVN